MGWEETFDEAEQVFTPARRRKIYHAVALVLAVLTIHGVVTAEQATAYLVALAPVLGVAAAELAAKNVPEGE